MELQTLNAELREGKGKGPAHRTRSAGQIPGVLYGGGKDPISLIVNQREFEHLVHGRGGENAIVQLDVKSSPDLNSPAQLKSVQHHPINERILHFDLMRIRLDQRIQTQVPVVLTGRSKGIVDGGVQDHQLHEIEVECLALDVPGQIEVDITELGIGDALHVSNLTPPPGVTFLTDGERAVVAIHAPRVEAPAAAEGAEGEVAPEGEGEAKEESD